MKVIVNSSSRMLEEGIRISPRWQNWLRDELEKLEKEPVV